MTFKDTIRCHIPEENWIDKEHAKCDWDHSDPELNKFCHEIVERDRQRRRKLCDENPPPVKIVSQDNQ